MIIFTRRPSADMALAELTHMARSPIDMVLAERQHTAYCAALAETGAAEVITLPALPNHPDCAFVEDVLVSLPALNILCRPGAASRRGEVDAVAGALPGDRPVVRIIAPGTIDGGDVLLVGRTLFVGRSTRTNDSGIAALATIVGRYGYGVKAIAVAGALHLKTAVTALAPDLLLMNPDWIDPAAFAGWRFIAVDPHEPFAGNSLSIGAHVFIATAHSATAERIRAAGFTTTLIDISEFAKAEAGLTCMSVLIASAE